MKVKNAYMIIGAAIISLAIGVAVPAALSPHSSGITVDHEAIKKRTIEQFKQEVASVYQADTEKKQNIEAAENTNIRTQDGSMEEVNNNEENIQEPAAVSEEVASRQPSESPALVEEKKENVKLVDSQWIQDRINENRDKISDEDLYKGAPIFNSLDTGYLFGLAEGGLTEEEKFEAQTYLSANLTGEQYSIVKDLYFKYVGLLNGE